MQASFTPGKALLAASQPAECTYSGARQSQADEGQSAKNVKLKQEIAALKLSALKNQAMLAAGSPYIVGQTLGEGRGVRSMASTPTLSAMQRPVPASISAPSAVGMAASVCLSEERDKDDINSVDNDVDDALEKARRQVFLAKSYLKEYAAATRDDAGSGIDH